MLAELAMSCAAEGLAGLVEGAISGAPGSGNKDVPLIFSIDNFRWLTVEAPGHETLQVQSIVKKYEHQYYQIK